MRTALFALLVFVIPAAAAADSSRFPIEPRNFESRASIQETLRSLSLRDRQLTTVPAPPRIERTQQLDRVDRPEKPECKGAADDCE